MEARVAKAEPVKDSRGLVSDLGQGRRKLAAKSCGAGVLGAKDAV